jgi:hypothetical protein
MQNECNHKGLNIADSQGNVPSRRVSRLHIVGDGSKFQIGNVHPEASQSYTASFHGFESRLKASKDSLDRGSASVNGLNREARSGRNPCEAIGEVGKAVGIPQAIVHWRALGNELREPKGLKVQEAPIGIFGPEVREYFLGNVNDFTNRYRSVKGPADSCVNDEINRSIAQSACRREGRADGADTCCQDMHDVAGSRDVLAQPLA